MPDFDLTVISRLSGVPIPLSPFNLLTSAAMLLEYAVLIGSSPNGRPLKKIDAGIPTTPSASFTALSLMSGFPFVENNPVLEATGKSFPVKKEAIDLNVPAIHASPVKSREMIKQGARSCLSRVGPVERFWVDPPYEMVRITRPNEQGVVQRAINRADDFIDLITQPPQYEDMAGPESSGV